MNSNKTTRLLFVTPDAERSSLARVINSLPDLQVDFTMSGYEGIAMLRSSSYDAFLACFPLDDFSPEELLEEAQRIDCLLPVVVNSPGAKLQDAVRLTKLGAWHCLGSEFDSEGIGDLLKKAAEEVRDRRAIRHGMAGSQEPWRDFLIGDSKSMQNVFEVIRLIGARRSTVLITGETGTGKEMVARAIHMASPRSHMPMVAVNCSALPENLLEAELFGHIKGAFTGAVNNRMGRFEQANRSTIFLDEIGDMPMDLQAKLLRVLQEREFQRLGSSETIKVDVRVLAASNMDLVEKINQGKFREDLYYRLNVVPLRLPPLRERMRDVPLLIHHFIDKICREEGLPPRQISSETLTRLTGYDWPGNVRQLENAVEMAIALTGDRLTLCPGDFPLPQKASRKPVSLSVSPIVAIPDDGLDFEQTVGGIERAILEQAMRKAGGNKKQAADMLRLRRTTFSAKLKSLQDAVAKAHVCAAG